MYLATGIDNKANIPSVMPVHILIFLSLCNLWLVSQVMILTPLYTYVLIGLM